MKSVTLIKLYEKCVWFYFFSVVVAACALMMSVCVGCSLHNDSDGIVRIDVAEALADGKSVGLSKYTSAIDYIPLETSSQSLLCDHSRIFYDKGKFFIVSHHNYGADDVPFFDECGKYLGRIGKAGGGPGEYNQLWSCFIVDDKETTNLCITGHNKGCIYDLSGQCINEVSFDSVSELTGQRPNLFSAYFKYIGDGMFCLLANSFKDREMDEYLFVLDSFGNIIKQFNIGKAAVRTSYLNGKVRKAFSLSSIYPSSSRLSMIGTSGDTLFTVDCESGARSAKVVFTIGSKPFGEVSAQNSDFILGDALECERFILRHVVCPKGDLPDVYRYLERVPHKAFAWLLYDKVERTYTALKFNKVSESGLEGLEGFHNDLDGGMPFLPSYFKDGKMYQLVDALTFIEMSDNCTSPKMKEVASLLTEESNPVMVVATLK